MHARIAINDEPLPTTRTRPCFAVNPARPTIRRLAIVGTETSSLNGVRCEPSLALVTYTLAIDKELRDCLFPVATVPFAPSLRSMPLRRSFTRGLWEATVSQELPTYVVRFVYRFVLGDREAHEVIDGVVEAVAVKVVDVVARRNGSERGLPYFLVKPANALASVGTVRRVVGLVRPILRLGVAIEEDAVESDRVLFHTSIVSPYRKASNRCQPLP